MKNWCRYKLKLKTLKICQDTVRTISFKSKLAFFTRLRPFTFFKSMSNTMYNKHTSIERETSHISVDVYEYIHVFTYIILMIPHHQP